MDFSTYGAQELVTVFNDSLIDLLEQLEIIIVSLSEQNIVDKRSKANLEFYKNLINKAVSLSDEVVIEGFGSYILKTPGFVEKIVERDDDFFLQYNFNDDTQDKNLRELVMIIKNIIGYLNADNKGIIFDYLNILCQATVVYAGKKYI
jgi:hypothetical protein